MPRDRTDVSPPGRHRAFRRWTALVVRELAQLRAGVYVAARGESRLLLSFAGRLATIDHDAQNVWITFEGSGVTDPPLVLERRGAATAKSVARTLAAFFGTE